MGKRGGGMPAVFARGESAWEAKGGLCEGGVLLLSYQLALPGGDGLCALGSPRAAARIEQFYARIAEEMWRECEGRLFPSVRRAYEESDDPHKRFRFARFVLSAEWRLVGEGKDSVTVTRVLTLSRRGKVLRRAEWREVFSKKSGRLAFLLSERILSLLAPAWRRRGNQENKQEGKQKNEQESKQKEG